MSAKNGSEPRSDLRSSHPVPTGERDLALHVPSELIEAIAERTAEMLAGRLPESPEPYLDVDAAAEYLACSRDRVYDLRRQGLAHFKDGTRLLFRREDLDRWLTKGDP